MRLRLSKRQPGQAVGPQGQALEALQQAGRGMIRQMMSQFARGSGIGFGAINPLRGMRDPLGRDWGDEDQEGVGDDINQVKIPDIGTIERIQDILDELRNRAGQLHRPQLELDYIDRLLRRFCGYCWIMLRSPSASSDCSPSSGTKKFVAGIG